MAEFIMSDNIFEQFLLLLPSLRAHHAPDSQLHAFLKLVARKETERTFATLEQKPKEFKPFGNLVFPYYNMGAVDSLNLFDLDELIIFSFYWSNRNKYDRVADIGACIGLHSIILSKCDYEVKSYEPEPQHFKLLTTNLALNNSKAQTFNKAVSNQSGSADFVKVIGNTTSSHIVDSKKAPYGELEYFSVNVEKIHSIMEWADLIKLDVEGHEKEILLATNQDQWATTDALVEVSNAENAHAIFKHFENIDVSLFSQKVNWRSVSDVVEMPMSYKDGTLFITSKREMPW